MHKKIWSESLKERDHTEELCAVGEIMLEWILRKYGGNVLTGFVWLRMGTSFRLL
jgi:hypothetical protein